MNAIFFAIASIHIFHQTSKPHVTNYSDCLKRLLLNDRLYQYEIIISECTIGQTTMIWLCGNITSIPRPGNTLHIRPGHYSSCSS